MALGAEPQDHRIDLDRVDVFRAVLQRRRDVRAGAGAEDQHLVEGVAEHGVRPLVEILLVRDRRHRLVKDVIHLDDGVRAVLEERDAVVGRPQAAALHAEDEQQRAGEQRQVGGGDELLSLPQQGRGRGARHAEPHQRRQLQPRHQRERGDAGQAAEKIDHICPERRTSRQLASHAMRDGGEERGDRDEQQRQQQRAFHRDDGVRGAAREIDRRGARQRDLEAQPIDRENQRELDQRKPDEEIAPPIGEQTADADAEEAGEQDEVGKICEQPDVGRQPANERGFEEEDEEGGEEQRHRATIMAEG